MNSYEVMIKPPVFTTIYEAPESWRHIGYVPITVTQLNAILSRAHDFGEGDVPNYGKAKAEFRNNNKVENGQWVAKSKEELAQDAADSAAKTSPTMVVQSEVVEEK